MSLPIEELSMDLFEQVLSRLGLSDRPAPTFDGLQRLYAAWCRKVPFDPEPNHHVSLGVHGRRPRLRRPAAPGLYPTPA
jgi:hypothetical protein